MSYSITVHRGVSVKADPAEAGHTRVQRLWNGVCALLLYSALWGGLCSMASLSTTGVLPLCLGGLFALTAALTAQNRKLWVWLAAGIAVAAVLLLLRPQTALDGAKLILNRLFAASEAQQAYTYETFTVLAAERAWRSCMRYALVPLGIVTGLACGTAVRQSSKLLLAAIFLLCSGLAAYLGVSPAAGWTVLLAFALLLSLMDLPANTCLPSRLLHCTGVLLILALICVLVLTALPGENSRLSAWEERARDALALQTAAYAEPPRGEQTPKAERAGEERQFYRDEETPGAFGGDGAEWAKPLPAILIITLFALLLFLPALFSDLLKKRRVRNRAGLDDPDHAAAIRATFLYALRWLHLGGLAAANVPFSSYAGQVGDILSEDIRHSYESALALWQEAAYSTHAMSEDQRMEMRAFMETVKRAVWDRLGKRARILANYIYAL